MLRRRALAFAFPAAAAAAGPAADGAEGAAVDGAEGAPGAGLGRGGLWNHFGYVCASGAAFGGVTGATEPAIATAI